MTVIVLSQIMTMMIVIRASYERTERLAVSTQAFRIRLETEIALQRLSCRVSA